MTRSPKVTANQVVSVLKRANFIILRQKGSHLIMRHESDMSRRCVIPVHGSQIIKPGTFHSILNGANLSVEEFIDLLR